MVVWNTSNETKTNYGSWQETNGRRFPKVYSYQDGLKPQMLFMNPLKWKYQSETF